MADRDTTQKTPGMAAGDRGDPKAQASGPKGDDPATAGHGETTVHTGPAEQAEGRLNPSSPANTGTTPGSNADAG